MSDSAGRDEAAELLALSDEELGRTMRTAMTDPRQLDPPPTTDKDGNPLARLDLNRPPPSTDDPLVRLCYALLAELPEHWQKATVDVGAAADEVRMFVVVRMPGEGHHYRNLHYLPAVAEAAAALRRSMYEAGGRGAWYRAMIQLYRDGTALPHYHFDEEPFLHWGPGEVELLRRDHELYPRDSEHLPPWHPVSPTEPPA
ncbi:hypothetical protein [Jiangella alba]|nr:hypothetical protein [Jiangella alba]